MDENQAQGTEDSSYPEPEVVSPEGVPTSIATMLIVMLALTFATAIWFARHEPSDKRCELTNATVQEQNAAEKARQDYATATMRHDIELRLEVVHQCVAAGNIPIFMSGNVDCKRPPK